ncbi:MAG: hypothetical protein IKD08_01595 [Alphaproteobacteria bacterium]|nr:hypothetical protein [Alphaproteobacteria bacterium]
MITVTDLSQAIQALSSANDKETLLVTPISASSYLGISYFLSLCRKVSEACPTCPHKFFLDCGNNAGEALSAIRSGVKYVIFTGNQKAFARLSSIAAKMDCDLRQSR